MKMVFLIPYPIPLPPHRQPLFCFFIILCEFIGLFHISPLYKTQYSILTILHFAFSFLLNNMSGRDFHIGT